MTFQQLTYVAEISKCGSINKAAHKLMISQSAISTAVRDLEAELGIRFFIRSNRGVDFTPEGREFLGYAISLLEQKQRIERLYGEARDSAAPARFSVSTQRYPFTEDAFLRLLHTTQENCFHFSVKETGMDAVIDDVYDHRSEIGVICMTELTEKLIRRMLDTRGLAFHEVTAVSPCIYVRSSHPLAKAVSVSVDELEAYPYVSFEQTQGAAADFSEEHPLLSMKRPDRSISVNDRATMMSVLAHTDAFTTGSGLLTDSFFTEAVTTVPLTEDSRIRIGWIASRDSRLSPLAEQFVNLLQEAIGDSIRFTEQLRSTRT